MAAASDLFLAFGLIEIINESLELGILNVDCTGKNLMEYIDQLESDFDLIC
jgi:hypothetical protein